MKRILMVTAAVAALGLAGCTEAQKDDSWMITCLSVGPANLLFNTFAAGGRVPQKSIDNVNVAVAGAQALCAGPRPTNVLTALRSLNAFLTAIAEETRKARAAAAAA